MEDIREAGMFSVQTASVQNTILSEPTFCSSEINHRHNPFEACLYREVHRINRSMFFGNLPSEVADKLKLVLR